MNIKIQRVSESGHVDFSYNELIVEEKKRKEYRLSEKWFDRFLSLMIKSAGRGSFHEHAWLNWIVFVPEKGNEKRVEALYRNFRKNLLWKNLIGLFLVLLTLGLLLLIIF